LRVDPTAVRGAAAQAGAAAGAATPGCAQVQPCAQDVVSVAASTRFAAQVELARKYTAMANAMARQFGVMLDGSATAYDGQEAASAALLGGQDPAVLAVSAGMALPAGLSEVSALLGGHGLSAPPVPAGEVPQAPRDIARLIETGRGGAGRRAWETVETSLRSEANELDDAAGQLGAAIGSSEDGWDSPSAQAATTRMRALQTWYQGHASYVRGLAEAARTHVQNFQRATTSIPTYKQVVDGERELKMAQDANQRSRGMLKPAVVHAQVKLGQLYQASTTGFASYTAAEAAPPPQLPTPPPAPRPNAPDIMPAKGSGEARVGNPKPEPSPTSAPLDPVQPGSGVAQDFASGGPAWPPAGIDPASPADPLVDTVSDTAGSAVPRLVPGIIGGVVGGVGGVLGGLVGAGQKALQNLEQAASPMMSGLGQHPAGGGSPQGGEQSPQAPGPQPPTDMSAPGDVGGGGGADTEPAGGAEPLSAPTAVAAAPAAAVPASAPTPAAAAEAPAPAMGAMGPMVPPLMGGPRSDASGPDDKQLYRERRLKVVAPPNSEPVKNRREGREKARGADRKAT
jgi:hypothetical protein